jgi:16S rRNA (adenine1518-N6/adenine1519-N6)-dimethyltransferase
MRSTPHIEAKKSLGQHFLTTARVPKRMIEAVSVKKGDTVLEIGPGTGVLTREILKTGAKVVAVEADARAIESLKETFSAEIKAQNLVLIHDDIRTRTLASLAPHITPFKYKVVANIPYYLSGMLFRTFLETDVQPSDLVFLVQKEVAERIARDPKESLLSLSVKVFGDPQYVETVKRGNFTPPPKVDSAIVAVRTISKKRLGKVSEADFFALIHAGFSSKRKQLLGNLTKLFPRDLLIHTFSTLGLRQDVRGEDLPLGTWLLLAEKLYTDS